MTERGAELFLEKEKFKIVNRAVASAIDNLIDIKSKIKFPWVMKAAGKKIVHKTKLGGIKLNINSQEEASKAFEELSDIPGFEEAIIQEEISGEEVIIGLKKAPEFGMVIMFGKGGTRVEEEKDISFRVLPIAKSEINSFIKEVKFYKTLEEKNIKIDLIKKVLLDISKLSEKYPNIVELDINPLMVSNKKAVVVDARIVFEE